MSTPTMTNPSSIAARLRASHAIEAAVATHGSDAAEILDARYADGDGEAADHRVFFANLGGEMRSARDRMTATNDDHLAVLARLAGLRKERDAGKEALAGDFYVARRTLEALSGSDQGFEVLAVAGKTPQDPTGLVRQVRATVAFLAAPSSPLPGAELGIAVDLTTMAARLAAGADGLEAVLAAVDRERKRAQTTRQAKNQALAAFDRTLRWVARTLEGLFHLAGLHDLAERVRPSSRRSAASEETETAEGPAAEDSAAAEEETGDGASDEVAGAGDAAGGAGLAPAFDPR